MIDSVDQVQVASRPLVRAANHRHWDPPSFGWIIWTMGVALGCVIASGCQTHGERAIKLQEQSGKMNRSSDFGWFAICKTETPGSHAETWKGQLVPSQERAMRDALDHEKQNPGHHATVSHD